jgi:phenylpropionate dioxygenase-like ring-hydroxylating dioxygenase large terminal subunit
MIETPDALRFEPKGHIMEERKPRVRRKARKPKQHGDFVRVGTLDELKRKRMKVVSGRRFPILVAHDKGGLHALDNRCPHLGFPLHRGSVEDGILTCH